MQQPNPPKTMRNAKARAKSQTQPVYISGIRGQHTLETGVAYHYRGHYVYASPAGNPIEPVPFSTKKGINIIGTVRYLAPRYDPNAPELVPEESIGALSKACWLREQDAAKAVAEEQADGTDDDDDDAAALEMPAVVRSGAHELRPLPGEAAVPYSTPLVPSQVSSRVGSRQNSYAELPYLTVLDARSQPGDSAASHSIVFQSRPSSQPDLPMARPGSSASIVGCDTHVGYAGSSSATIPGLRHSSLQVLLYTPHDRAVFLADSAPGSRIASHTNTPHGSRSVSPHHAHPTLRQVASTTRLTQLLAEERMPRAFSPLSDVVEGNTTFSATTSCGLADTATNLFPEDSSSAMSALDEIASPPYSRNNPIGTGRPRRASMALNQAYNAAKSGSQAVVSARLPMCALHGEDCDGVSVAETWKTQHAKNTTVFKELFPVVQGASDRVMVDWHRLLREEQMAMGG
jgi:hypothetical protein